MALRHCAPRCSMPLEQRQHCISPLSLSLSLSRFGVQRIKTGAGEAEESSEVTGGGLPQAPGIASETLQLLRRGRAPAPAIHGSQPRVQRHAAEGAARSIP